jgi:hypothetical protein
MNQPNQYSYSQLNEAMELQTETYIQQWDFKYNSTETGQYAMVKIKFYPMYSEMIEFVVELNGVPIADGASKDVTVDWFFYDFDANSTFWTDSNGLEMQKRILNYRPTWNYSGDQNISSNYYPVGSGIAMRDINSTRQITIINERAQAGSANLIPNSIELI